ncbi:MAG: hypothetical protein JO180_08935 [Gemmatirosa sp.]|nr:hypothetical protein [Gemmatirosa sp.]
MPIVYDAAQVPVPPTPPTPPADRGPATDGPFTVQNVQVITGPDGHVTVVGDQGPIDTQNDGSAVRVMVGGQAIEIDPSLLREALRGRLRDDLRHGLRDNLREALRNPRSLRHASSDVGTEIRVNDEPVPDDAILGIGFGAGALLSMLFALLVILPLTRVLMRRSARRAARPSTELQAMPPRLERIEHAVEAIAVEVERIAEAQRYSARLLNERLVEVTGPLPVRAPIAGRVPTPH